MKLFWFLGHFGLAHKDHSLGESSDGYQIADPISIVSRVCVSDVSDLKLETIFACW